MQISTNARGPLNHLPTDTAHIWLAAAALTLALIALRSFVSLDPGQVAVRVNNLTGAIETITQPGLVLQLPFDIHSVQILDASPQTFHMRGERNVDELLARELTVRASDGSNFIFNDTTILFRVIPDHGSRVIADAGSGHRYLMWMSPFSRSILRDEFGRESTISVSNPTTFGQATERARTRMNDLLNPHGIEVTAIVTPRPRFSEEYEDLIEARNQAENELSVIASNLERAATDRTRRLAEVDRDQNKVMQQKRAEMEQVLATATATQTQAHREIDSYRISTIAAGEAALSAARQKSVQLQGQLEAQYASRKAQIEPFRNQPVERVMERLGQRLAGSTINIQPWSSDAMPSRLQVEQMGAAAQ